jgi:RNA polymerase sigma-70 factor (ECF subfamily)
MSALVEAIPGTAVRQAEPLHQEFEARLTASASLAFRVALSVVRNRADAEDIAQEALVRAYRSFHRLRDPGQFRGWLARIAWRLALDRRREAARRARREMGYVAAAAQANPEHLAAGDEFRRRLSAALDELPESLRIVVVLAAIEGHSMAEVAELVGASEGTVKSRLHRARLKLAERLR